MSSGQLPGWPEDPVKNPEVSGDPSQEINPDALGPAPTVAPQTARVSLPAVSTGAEPAMPVYRADSYDAVCEYLLSRQNPLLGILGGLLGAAVGGTVFGPISGLITWYFGLVPIVLVGAGVGWFAGMGTRLLGRTASPVYAVAAASFALVGTAWGHWLDVAVNLAASPKCSTLGEAFGVVFAQPWQYLNAGSGPLGYLGFPVAAIVAFFSAFRSVRRAAMAHLVRERQGGASPLP